MVKIDNMLVTICKIRNENLKHAARCDLQLYDGANTYYLTRWPATAVNMTQLMIVTLEINDRPLMQMYDNSQLCCAAWFAK